VSVAALRNVSEEEMEDSFQILREKRNFGTSMQKVNLKTPPKTGAF
jgi:hypothetical protein